MLEIFIPKGYKKVKTGLPVKTSYSFKLDEEDYSIWRDGNFRRATNNRIVNRGEYAFLNII